MSGLETGDETEWTSESATATTAQFRSGGYSVLLNDTGSEFVSSEVSTMAQLGLRFGLRLADSTPSSTQDVLTISQTTTNIWIIHILTDGKVRVQNLANSTNYDSSGAVFSDNTWHLVEFNGLVHNSTGNFDLRVDGAEVITQSSLDTDPAVATLNRIRLDGYASGVGDIWVDDVYWINTLSYPGDGKIVALQPNASGDETSSNWLWIREISLLVQPSRPHTEPLLILPKEIFRNVYRQYFRLIVIYIILSPQGERFYSALKTPLSGE